MDAGAGGQGSLGGVTGGGGGLAGGAGAGCCVGVNRGAGRRSTRVSPPEDADGVNDAADLAGGGGIVGSGATGGDCGGATVSVGVGAERLLRDGRRRLGPHLVPERLRVLGGHPDARGGVEHLVFCQRARDERDRRFHVKVLTLDMLQ